jgi:hypothetical protein
MARVELIHERLTHSVIGAFFEVYHTLGFSGQRIWNSASSYILGHDQDSIGVICTNPTARAPKIPLSRVPPLPRGPRNPSVVEASGNALATD